MVDVTVINRHQLIAADLEHGLLYHSTAEVLDHRSVGVGGGQGDCESQSCSPGDNDIMGAKVGEPNKKLLVLINRTGVVCHNN